MLFEMWAFRLEDDLGEVLGQLADHTFIRVPGNGGLFECWGGTSGRHLRIVGTALASYNWANCYRYPLVLGGVLRPDTAGIGMYAIHGVCHQSANCFLLSSGKVLDIGEVRGLWFSILLYGLWGTNFGPWSLLVYRPCKAGPFALPPAEDEEQPDVPQAGTDPIVDTVLQIHAKQTASADPNATLVAEGDAVTKYYLPEVPDVDYSDLHWELLRAKDLLVSQGYQGNELALRLNDLARLMQAKFRVRIGDDLYKRLMGVDDASITLGIVEPGLADAAGVPLPPPLDEASFDSQSVPALMVAGERYAVSVKMINTGTTTWRPGRYSLGSQEPADTLRWGVSRVPVPGYVGPGGEAIFNFEVVAPFTLDEPAAFRWKMVRENVAWFGERNLHVPVTVVKDARFVSQDVPAAMVAGTTRPVSITMRNISGVTWSRGRIRLGSQNPQDNTTWGLARVDLPHDVPSESDVTFAFPIRAPATVANYNFQWRMVQEGTGWLGQRSLNVEMRVMPPLTKAAVFVSQNVPNPMPPGSTQTVAVTMRNVGTATWTASEQYKLGAQNPMDNTRWGTNRVPLPHDVLPNGEVTFAFQVPTREGENIYNFQWQMVQDAAGGGWFGQITPNVEVRVAYPLRGALFVRQTVPESIRIVNPPTASVTLRNTGAETWTPASRYKLGSQNPADNVRWGTNRISVPHDVPPNTEVTFAIPMRTTTTGLKNFQWGMVLDGVAWFGQTTPNVAVTVR